MRGVSGVSDVTEDSSEDTAEGRARRAYERAVRLLAARDHSSAGLRRKLAERGFDPAAIDAALATLLEAGYVDDARFALTLAGQRAAKGYGPLAIRQRLVDRGIDRGEAEDAIGALGADWVERAGEALAARFSAADIASEEPRVRARIARFLQGRGFAASDALRALDEARRRIERESLERG